MSADAGHLKFSERKQALIGEKVMGRKSDAE